jgi:hypothetical protein
LAAALLAELDDSPLRAAQLPAALDEHDVEDADVEDYISRMPPQLRESYLRGEVAARIAWGTPGDITRCMAQARGARRSRAYGGRDVRAAAPFGDRDVAAQKQMIRRSGALQRSPLPSHGFQIRSQCRELSPQQGPVQGEESKAEVCQYERHE